MKRWVSSYSLADLVPDLAESGSGNSVSRKKRHHRHLQLSTSGVFEEREFLIQLAQFGRLTFVSSLCSAVPAS